MRTLLMLVVALILTACASGHQQFYKPYVDPKTLPDVELLKPGAEPKVFGTNDMNKDIRVLRSKMFIPIGYSSFNGKYEDESVVKAQAKRVGATIVLVDSQYTNTQTINSPLFIPNSSVVYHTGSVYGGGFQGGYSGTSTAYGSTVVPIETYQRRYDQSAVFLVKSFKKLKFGVTIYDLNDEHRRELERNTGAIIEIVIKDSPAFYSNVLPGDFLIKVNGIDVRDAQHALDLMKSVNFNDDKAVFTIIRNGKEKEILIKFKKTE